MTQEEEIKQFKKAINEAEKSMAVVTSKQMDIAEALLEEFGITDVNQIPNVIEQLEKNFKVQKQKSDTLFTELKEKFDNINEE